MGNAGRYGRTYLSVWAGSERGPQGGDPGRPGQPNIGCTIGGYLAAQLNRYTTHRACSVFELRRLSGRPFGTGNLAISTIGGEDPWGEAHLLRQQSVGGFWAHSASGELDDDLGGRHGVGGPERGPDEDEREDELVEMHGGEREAGWGTAIALVGV